MTTFRPCIGCTARADCEIKKSAVKALRGVPITSAKIKCDLPFTRYFPAGTRVKVMVWDQNDFSSYEGGTPAKMASSTVVGPSTKKRGKLLCHLDAAIAIGDKEIEFCTAWPKDVEKLDEPARDACPSCKRAYVKGNCSCLDDDRGAW